MTTTTRTRALGVSAILAMAALVLAAPGAAQPVRVALGDTVSVDTLAFVIALERAKERGVEYTLTSFAKEDLAIQALIGGQADVGAATPYSVMQKTKAPLRGLFQLTRLVFFPVADHSYRTWKDLDGQPFTFHARGSGTEAIGNILAKRHGITFGQRNYIAGSENRVVAMLNGQIKATILDLANKNLLMQRASDRFHVLPGADNPASDEVLFARVDWMEKNGPKVDVLVEEFLRLWTEMNKDPGMIEPERAKRGLLKDLPKEVLADVTKFHVQAVEAGVFSRSGGDVEAVKADFEFYVEAGQMKGPLEALKVEDFWSLAPLERARRKLSR
jgi:NitT/TauT family transport system substrate-binding protein